MLNSLFDGTALPLLEKVAVFGEKRQEVLAGNIANIDTPGYKTRDLPVAAFQEALRHAVARGSAGDDAAGTPVAGSAQAASLDSLFPRELFQVTQSPQRDITFQDAANRSIEGEIMELTKNNLTQSFAIELMHSQMNLLQSVIREQA